MPNDWLSVPHFKQEFNYSCVPACARMVLAHFGQTCTEDDLRQLLGTGPHGTRARNLLALAGLGFQVQLAVCNLADLQAALAAGTPPVVFFQTAGIDYWSADCAHVAVLVGLTSTTAYLNDPFFDTAPQSTSLANFRQAWATTGHLAAIIRPQP